MTKGYSMVILKMSQEGQGKIVVRVVHACCWEIKVTRVLQNLSNLKVGHFFFINAYFGLVLSQLLYVELLESC